MIYLYGLAALVIYFGILTLLLVNTQNKNAIFHITFLFSVIYVCVLIMLILFSTYLEGSGQLLFSVFLIVGVLYPVYGLYQLVTKNKDISIQKAITFVTLTYIFALMYITLFSRGGNHEFGIKMDPGRFLIATLNGTEPHALKHAVQNIGMFVPLGVLFPHCIKNLRRPFIHTLLFSITASVCIEVFQLLQKCGTCDIDDIFMNCLGACIGFVFSTLIRDLID